jgi:hypothetical protein
MEELQRAFAKMGAVLTALTPVIQNLMAVLDEQVIPMSVDFLLWDMQLTGEFDPFAP